MVELPTEITAEQKTVDAIYRAYELEAERTKRRSDGIGISTAGEKCARKIWYGFRWCSPIVAFEGRMLRLFDTGKQEEPRMVQDLHSIGCEVFPLDPATGDQFRIESGHVHGYLDGVARGILEAPKTWHLLEFKTHSAKSFKELQKKGVKAAKPAHYAQCMLGMGLAQPKLERALYLAKNKDTDELYQERIRYNADEFIAYKSRLDEIITAERPPARIADSPEAWDCKYCEHKCLCHKVGRETNTAPFPEKNCRTCLHSTPAVDGSWLCEAQENLVLSQHNQQAACPEHLFIPDLLPYEFLKVKDGMVVYRRINGDLIFNQPGGEISEVPF